MKTILIILSLVLTVGSCSVNKRSYGTYYNKWRYFGADYILKPDSTFIYKFRNNAGEVTTIVETPLGNITRTTSSYLFRDSSYGKYSMNGDTVFLNYYTDIIKGDFHGNNIRPKKLLWQGKKLFYIVEATGEIIRQKEHYMQWRKGLL